VSFAVLGTADSLTPPPLRLPGLDPDRRYRVLGSSSPAASSPPSGSSLPSSTPSPPSSSISPARPNGLPEAAGQGTETHPVGQTGRWETGQMAIELRVPTEDDWDEMSRVDGVVFGAVWTPEELEATRPTIEFERFRVATDDGRIVGVAGSYGLEMTMPGGRTLPTGGVTWVGVLVTHRRQGILRRLMEAVHDDIDARGEPLAALTASEGAIYERFGYGIASLDRVVQIDRRRAQFRPGLAPPPGAVRLMEGEELVAALCDRWDRLRLLRPGQIDRPEQLHRKLIAQRGPGTTYAVHADGVAAWKITQQWHNGHPAHEVRLFDLAAATPEAHLALWHTVLSLDLVGPITSGNVPMDDPLPYLLVDHRALRTTEVNDGVWLNVRSVPDVFGARTYGTDDDVVVEVDGNRWRIGAGGCTRVRSRPDLVTDHASLGALVLGGIRPSALAAGRRLTARNDEALGRADALFVTSPSPYCQTGF
jgi:predicted acetyltransferase